MLSEEKSKVKTKLQNPIMMQVPVEKLAQNLFLDKTFSASTLAGQLKMKMAAAKWVCLYSIKFYSYFKATY